MPRRKKSAQAESEILSTALPYIRDLIHQSQVLIKLSTEGDAEFRYAEAIVGDIAGKTGLERGQVEALLEARLPEMVTAILKRRRNMLISFETEVVPKGEEAPSKDEVEKCLDSVEGFLIDDTLQRRVAVKRMAKCDTFLDASWEILEKRADASGPMRSDLFYGIMRIDVDRPGVERERGFIFPPWTPSLVPFSISVFALDLDEVRYLKKLLDELEHRLSEVPAERREAPP